MRKFQEGEKTVGFQSKIKVKIAIVLNRDFTIFVFIDKDVSEVYLLLFSLLYCV
jgi:hypothetical protein